MANKLFLDSNILLYAVGPDVKKGIRASELFKLEPTISIQVLNEFVNVARNKLKLPWETVEKAMATAYEFCSIVDLTIETHKRALEVSKSHLINIYDANIIAAAELAGCDVLYTEDLNDGQRIGRVTIRNPFM